MKLTRRGFLKALGLAAPAAVAVTVLPKAVEEPDRMMLVGRENYRLLMGYTEPQVIKFGRVEDPNDWGTPIVSHIENTRNARMRDMLDAIYLG